MAIPFNDLRRRVAPWQSDLEAVCQRVLARGWFVHGPELVAFEREFAATLGLPAEQVAGVANGTDALELALKAVGVRPGDAVATVANAGGYSSTAIRAAGARPIFVDIAPTNLLMDLDALAATLAADRPRAIVATHLYGRMLAMAPLLKIARRHEVAVVEDVAQAHGAQRDGRPAGSWGDAAAFSFYPTKNLGALGDGGAVAATAPATIQTVRELRQYGWTEKYRTDRVGGRNSRLDELQAAFLGVFLPQLPAWNARRRILAQRYSRELAGLGLALPDAEDPGYVAHLYVVQSAGRERLRQGLANAGIGTDIHYPVPDYAQAFGAAPPGGLPHTEAAAREILSLPLYPELTDHEAGLVIAAVRAV